MWLRPHGYATVTTPEAASGRLNGLKVEQFNSGTNEYDTVTCNHCNSVTHIRPRMDPADMGGLCKICMKMICAGCLDQGCKPFEKKIEEMEKADYLRRQNAMVMGL